MKNLRHAKRRTITSASALLVLGLLPLGATVQVAHADTAGPITFESSAYTLGSIDAQNGWSSTGGFDQGVVASSRFTSFGGQSFRISNAVTSGAFGNQTFSPAVTIPAGESPLQTHFDSTFQIGTTQDGVQTGLHMSVSPDNGSGARMSYLRFEDQADGVHVFFDDVTDAGPLGTVAAFNEADIATLDRASAHTIRFSIDFLAGPANDVAKIYIDGALKTTGTTWEDYYRYDPEAAGNGNQISPVSKLEFRESGDAIPASPGQGFLIDNLTLTSSATTNGCYFSTSDNAITLLADCTTDQTILVPDGKTLEGNGHSITAIDPSGGHFLGAVVENAGAKATVNNLTVSASNLATACDAFPKSLAGIRLDGASGAITNNKVLGLQQGSIGDGCQEGNAIEVRNTAATGTPQVTVTGNTVSRYQKTGVLVKGQVSATVTGNTITGYGPVDFIGQNGIQVSFGATALVESNTISDNFYLPKSWDACGLLIYHADGVKVGKNAFSGNEKNLCNTARGGTFSGL